MPKSSKTWYRSTVYMGDQLGRTIGFPTVNLDASILPIDTPHGVYSSTVRYKNQEYIGALYYGPRLVVNETKTVLEIYILGFDREIYGEEIAFRLGKFVRGVMNFDSLAALQQQLHQDVKNCEAPPPLPPRRNRPPPALTLRRGKKD